MSNTADKVCALVHERERAGIAEYGATCDRTDLRAIDWLRHARPELLDGAMYLTALERELPVVLRQAFDAGFASSQWGACPELAFKAVLAKALGA